MAAEIAAHAPRIEPITAPPDCTKKHRMQTPRRRACDPIRVVSTKSGMRRQTPPARRSPPTAAHGNRRHRRQCGRSGSVSSWSRASSASARTVAVRPLPGHRGGRTRPGCGCGRTRGRARRPTHSAGRSGSLPAAWLPCGEECRHRRGSFPPDASGTASRHAAGNRVGIDDVEPPEAAHACQSGLVAPVRASDDDQGRHERRLGQADCRSGATSTRSPSLVRAI